MISQHIEVVSVKEELEQLGSNKPEIAEEVKRLLNEEYPNNMPERIPRTEYYWWIRLADDNVNQAELELSSRPQSLRLSWCL